MRRFLPFAIAFTLFIALAGAATYFWNNGWNDHHNGTEVVQVVPAGTDAATGNTIVIAHENHRPFFFPGFLFIPFFFFFIFCIARLFWGPRRWGGWDGTYPPGSSPPAWFDQWHRDAHTPRPGVNEPTVSHPSTSMSQDDSDTTPS